MKKRQFRTLIAVMVFLFIAQNFINWRICGRHASWIRENTIPMHEHLEILYNLQESIK